MNHQPFLLPKCQHCTFRWPGFLLYLLGPKFKPFKYLFRLLHPSLVSAARAFLRVKTLLRAKIIKKLQGRIWFIPKHKKKALLVGLRYEGNEDNSTLNGPHKDVKAFKKLLMGKSDFLYINNV